MALFQPGQSGNPSGRTAGSKNKAKFEVAQILKDLNCDPFKILADLATSARSEKVRCEAASELAGYVAPKLKSIEVTTDPDNPVLVNINLKNANQLPSN